MIIADTSGLIAFFSESGSQHEAVTAWIGAHDPVMVVSPYVLAEAAVPARATGSNGALRI